MTLMIITKNHEADPEIGFSHKIGFKTVWPRNGLSASVGVKKLKIQFLVIIRYIEFEKWNSSRVYRLEGGFYSVRAEKSRVRVLRPSLKVLINSRCSYGVDKGV